MIVPSIVQKRIPAVVMDKSVNEHKDFSEVGKKSTCHLGCSQVQHNLFQKTQMEYSRIMFKYLCIEVTLVREGKSLESSDSF